MKFTENPFARTANERDPLKRLALQCVESCTGPEWDATKPHIKAIVTIANRFKKAYGHEVGEEVLQHILISVPKIYRNYIPFYGTPYRKFLLAWVGNEARAVLRKLRKNSVQSQSEEFTLEDRAYVVDFDFNLRQEQFKKLLELLEEEDRWFLEQRFVYERQYKSIQKIYNSKHAYSEKISSHTVARRVDAAITKLRIVANEHFRNI